MKRIALWIIAGAALATSAFTGSPGPAAVSPGSPASATRIESRCPTFSWGAVEAARSYELVVYRIGDDGGKAARVLLETLPGSVETWTPALDRCLARGERYAWAVRALGPSTPSAWSGPSLFQVAAEPSAMELGEALRTLRRYLGEQQAGSAELSADEAAAAPPSTLPETGPVAPALLPAAAGQGGGVAPGAPHVLGVAELTVDGEVRTMGDYEDPRLWGRGRPGVVRNGNLGGLCTNGSVRFGLSNIAVDWGSAADACPAGTWVCAPYERGSTVCDTIRADSTEDERACSGVPVDHDADDHLGWLASGPLEDKAGCGSEKGGPFVCWACKSLPVWCCDYS